MTWYSTLNHDVSPLLLPVVLFCGGMSWCRVHWRRPHAQATATEWIETYSAHLWLTTIHDQLAFTITIQSRRNFLQGRSFHKTATGNLCWVFQVQFSRVEYVDESPEHKMPPSFTTSQSALFEETIWWWFDCQLPIVLCSPHRTTVHFRSINAFLAQLPNKSEHDCSTPVNLRRTKSPFHRGPSIAILIDRRFLHMAVPSYKSGKITSVLLLCCSMYLLKFVFFTQQRRAASY